MAWTGTGEGGKIVGKRYGRTQNAGANLRPRIPIGLKVN